jgi:ATP-dependent Lon protease
MNVPPSPSVPPDPHAPFTPSVKPLGATQLRWRCDPAQLRFETTREVEPIRGVVGQDSAVEALRFGLETPAPGQNIFVRGLTGTGRMTLIRRLVQELRLSCPETHDRCYVHNFSQPDRPRLITLRRGQGKFFKRRLDDLADFVRDNLGRALTSESVTARQNVIEQDSQKEIKQVVEPFEQSLKEAGLAIASVTTGPTIQAVILPTFEGKPVPPDEWRQLRADGRVSDEADRLFRERHDAFQQPLQDITDRIAEIRRRHALASRQLVEDAARAALGVFCRDILANYPYPNVSVFLDELVTDVVTHRLREVEGEDYDFTRLYRANVVLAHAEEGCPIVIANTPTMMNLIGSVDHTFTPDGRRYADHLMIRAGTLLQADGGFLIVDAREILRDPPAWHVLIRTLRTGMLELAPQEQAMPWMGPSIKPEPIELRIKVVLIGDSEMYYMLDSFDPDFPDLFKVLADFDTVIPRSPGAIGQYAAILSRIAGDENLPAFERDAVAALVEHGSRIASRAGKLTARFGRLADIAREAAFMAGKDGRLTTTQEDVKHAIRAAKRRADLPSRRFRELLSDGTIQVQIKGRVVGQINGLAVMQAGPMVYGFPARITAAIGPGHAGMVNIDREASLSGALHTKGFYILGGLLRHLLRTAHPLTFHASLAFEQSYGEIDGDSASGAEICCMLSSLTDVPLRQELAITGAIDQKGHLMAIGGVNEKIEGFFDTCSDLGLTGAQGVIIPKANAGDLMLREDVVAACAEKRFHIYAVAEVAQALELLTEMPTGELGEDGFYPEGTLLGIAVERAFQYWVMASQGLGDMTPPEELQPDQPAPEDGADPESPE